MATAMESVTECGICFREYSVTVRPMILPCHHSFCLECVNRLEKGNEIQCPNDKKVLDFNSVVPDFRFDEFKQALNETEEDIPQSVSGGHGEKTKGGTKCELCDERPISCRCEDCEQWMCSYCEKVHLRAKGTKDHKINALESTSTNFQAELNFIQEKMFIFSKYIKKLSAEKKNSQQLQISTLAKSHALRQECIIGVNKDFDKKDAEILRIVEQYLAKIDESTKEFESQLENLETVLKQMSTVLTETTSDIVKRHECYTDCKLLLASIGTPRISITKLGITISQSKYWSPKGAAELKTNGGNIDIVQTSKSKTKSAGFPWPWKKHSPPQELTCRSSPP